MDGTAGQAARWDVLGHDGSGQTREGRTDGLTWLDMTDVYGREPTGWTYFWHSICQVMDMSPVCSGTCVGHALAVASASCGHVFGMFWLCIGHIVAICLFSIVEELIPNGLF